MANPLANMQSMVPQCIRGIPLLGDLMVKDIPLTSRTIYLTDISALISLLSLHNLPCIIRLYPQCYMLLPFHL